MMQDDSNAKKYLLEAINIFQTLNNTRMKKECQEKYKNLYEKQDYQEEDIFNEKDPELNAKFEQPSTKEKVIGKESGKKEVKKGKKF